MLVFQSKNSRKLRRPVAAGLVAMILVATVAVDVFAGASGGAPFFDGMTLVYEETLGQPGKAGLIWSREIRYRLKSVGDGSYAVTQTVVTKPGPGLKPGMDPVPFPKTNGLVIDSAGITKKGGDGIHFVEGTVGYLWLPGDRRQPGAEVIPGARRVGNKMLWLGRSVWPVTLADDPNVEVAYHDTETGILVGIDQAKGRLKTVLIDTNVESLKGFVHKARP